MTAAEWHEELERIAQNMREALGLIDEIIAKHEGRSVTELPANDSRD